MFTGNNQSGLRCIPGAMLIIGLLALAVLQRADAGALEAGTETPFGSFNKIDYIRYTGRFSGATATGPYRMPFEIVAPARPRRGNRTVVVEPPHFVFGLAGRDTTLGSSMLFERGFSHASVGFSENGFNMLDPTAVDAMIGGAPAIVNDFPFARDVEILRQFGEALKHDPYAVKILGRVKRRYAYGASQTAEALFELAYGPGAEGLFDLTVMHVPLWRPPFAQPDVLDVLPEEFVPLSDIGKVMFVGSEGDLFVSESLELRNAVVGPEANRNYRLYEVAGAPHLPLDPPLNPLDNAPVVRAAFAAGHRWVKRGFEPPASALLEVAPPGTIDPVYGFPTGIARNADGNALGGVQLPDVKVGRALFVASVPDEIVPGLPGLVGAWFDLSCAPLPGSMDPTPRFPSHRVYVRQVARQAIRLFFTGFLLPNDARSIVREAAHSDVGNPGTCDPGL